MSQNDNSDENRLAALKSMVKEAPAEPGVYLWKNADNVILYIGKAVKLRARLASYFGDKSLKAKHLVSKSSVIEYIVVHNEYEALVLENNLIKRYQPRYNIQLKDHKTYPLIRVTGEDFPRIFRTRAVVKDGSSYYGPFPSAKHVDTYLQLIDKIFPLRKCKCIPLKKRKAPCLYYHMGRSLGPCAGRTTKEEYGQIVKQVQKLLSGNVAAFIKDLTQQMNEAAANLDYEKAAQLRDAIQAVEISGIEQKMEDRSEERRDYLGFAGIGGLYFFVVLRMREGKLTGKSTFRIESPAQSDEALAEFLISYYSDSLEGERADVVYVENPPAGLAFARFFKEQYGQEIRLSQPIEERDVRLLRMAFENAMLDLSRAGNREEALLQLKEALNLPKLPRRIEGFDVAQLSGRFTVASLVSFKNGAPDKANYRRFRMKSLEEGEIDDFKSMSEAVARRFTRLLNEGLELPDLLLVDGGKGQVSAALSVLEALNLDKKVPLAGLAKREEEIFPAKAKEPIVLPAGSPALRILQAVRDETHRFATAYNQKLRASTLSLKTLESVEGIGPAKAKKLLVYYGSLQEIGRQTSESIAKIASISREKAQELLILVQKTAQI